MPPFVAGLVCGGGAALGFGPLGGGLIFPLLLPSLRGTRLFLVSIEPTFAKAIAASMVNSSGFLDKYITSVL